MRVEWPVTKPGGGRSGLRSQELGSRIHELGPRALQPPEGGHPGGKASVCFTLFRKLRARHKFALVNKCLVFSIVKPTNLRSVSSDKAKNRNEGPF